MLEWWINRPWWLRLGIAYALIILGLIVAIVGFMGRGGDDPLANHFSARELQGGVVATILGVALAVIGDRSDSEKNGYRF